MAKVERCDGVKAILVRVGVDQSYGCWNAPVDPDSGDFVYVPIPEKPGTQFNRGCERRYDELAPVLEHTAAVAEQDLYQDLRFPPSLLHDAMHLDPDFEHLTYGDVGNRRGAGMRDLTGGDLLVFYAGLRPVRPCDHRLVYAIIGLFVVDEVVYASSVPRSRWHENAHTRKQQWGESDIVVRARPEGSGRLTRCLPIGEYRDGAYRVYRDVLETWGGLSVKDGYLQRSAQPPHFNDPPRFYRWFQERQVPMMRRNNPQSQHSNVVMVHLRRPRRGAPNEKRTDPFWEFGSFGCTGCHKTNILHPKRADALDGARLAFAQGGPAGMKLVMLTPPVQTLHHRTRCEVRWSPVEMPFRYEAAPLLIDNEGYTHFPQLAEGLAGVDRSTWVAAVSSRFRSRVDPLPNAVAAEIERIYDQMRQEVSPAEMASEYWDALPSMPNNPDKHRRTTYKKLLSIADGGAAATGKCASPGPKVRHGC